MTIDNLREKFASLMFEIPYPLDELVSVAQAYANSERVDELKYWFGAPYLSEDGRLNTQPISVERIKNRIAGLLTQGEIDNEL